MHRPFIAITAAAVMALTITTGASPATSAATVSPRAISPGASCHPSSIVVRKHNVLDIHVIRISCSKAIAALRSRSWPRGWSCRIVREFGQTYVRRACTHGSQVIYFTGGRKPFWKT